MLKIFLTLLCIAATPLISQAKTAKPAKSEKVTREPASSESEVLMRLSVNDFSYKKGMNGETPVLNLSLKLNSSDCLELDKTKVRFAFERTESSVKITPYMMASGMQNCVGLPDLSIDVQVAMPYSVSSSTSPIDYAVILPKFISLFSARSEIETLNVIRVSLDIKDGSRRLQFNDNKPLVYKVTGSR